MAYTKAVFEVDAETGQSAIYLVDPTNTADRTPFTNPTANRTRILFHSALDYLEIVYDQTVTFNFPATSSSGSVRTYAFPNHSLGVIPHGVCKWGQKTIAGAITVQNVSAGYRTAFVSFSTTGATLHETAIVNSGTLAATTQTFRLMLLGMEQTAPASNKFLIDPQSGVVQFGQGKFINTGNRKLRMTNDAVPLMYLNKIGATMGTLGKGVRIVDSDGAVTNLSGYGGSFVSVGAWGVKA